MSKISGPPAAANPSRPPQVGRLVLTRRPGEAIHVDGPATFRIVEVDCDKVRIAVEAERHVTIIRTEIIGRYNGSRREVRA